ncbi:MAG: hypothetical protein QOC87_613 [Actinomycetota bacterium]|nr:hypothetical protein [Actinomycetota bacterium]
MSTTELPLTLDQAVTEPGPKRFSPARTAVALTVGAWAGLFWFVLLSGRLAL